MNGIITKAYFSQFKQHLKASIVLIEILKQFFKKLSGLKHLFPSKILLIFMLVQLIEQQAQILGYFHLLLKFCACFTVSLAPLLIFCNNDNGGEGKSSSKILYDKIENPMKLGIFLKLYSRSC